MNLASVLGSHPAERAALIHQGETITYGQLDDQVRRFAGGLVERGVTVGDRVGVMAANNPTFVVGALGAMAAGAIPVPINPREPIPALEAMLAMVDASALVVGPSAERALARAGATRPAGVDLVVAAPPVASDDFVDMNELLAAEPITPVERSADDLATLLFTSGTSGGTKAAMLTNANLVANQDQLRAASGATISPDDVVFAVLPFFHIYGLNVVLGLGLGQGATLLLIERFDPSHAVDSIERHQVTVMPAVPPIWAALLDLPGLETEKLSSLRRASSGAAALPARVFEGVRDRFGVTVAEGYGLTEASPAVTTSDEQDAVAGSIGRPLPGLEVRVVDDEGHDVVVGDPGEIWVRGPNVFTGYWEDPEATARVLDSEGWLHTGDIAVVDDEGRLFLVDRAKDLIIVSGFNVYPAEVEEVLAEHPGVDAVAVTGVPHPTTGEAVVAHVVVRPGVVLDEDELIEHCLDHLARYKCPKKVRITNELPIGASGKVVRRLLAE